MHLLALFLQFLVASLFSPSFILSLSLCCNLSLFFLDVPTVSIHFIFLQFSVPFRLFVACCSAWFHQVFWGMWKGGIQSGGHRWHIRTTSCASDGHESFDLHNGWAFFWGIPVRHRSATSDQCHECWRQRSMHEKHAWGCHMLPVHTQHLQEVQYILWPCHFNPMTPIHVSPAQTLCDPPCLSEASSPALDPVWVFEHLPANSFQLVENFLMCSLCTHSKGQSSKIDICPFTYSSCPCS